jgi:hypothetical protein
MNAYFRSLVTFRVSAWFGFVSFVRTAFLVLLLAWATNVQAQSWNATGSLGTGRYSGHTATLLAMPNFTIQLQDNGPPQAA